MYYFIVNEHGGSGKGSRRWDKVKPLLDEKKIEYEFFVPEYAGHATKIAQEISVRDDGDIKIVILGGDGTINEVLNGIADFSRVKLALIPTGSGNDFSRGLNLPRHNPKKSLEMILNAGEGRKIDLGVVESSENGKKRIFGISAGFGLDAIVGTGNNSSKIKVALNKMHLGKLSYAILTVKTLFSMKTQTARLKFDGEDWIEMKKLIFLAAMNFKAEGGGVPMSPKARGDDGKLSVCAAAGVPKILTFFLFPFLCLGLHSNMKGFFLRDFETLEIQSAEKSTLHTDGEFFGNVKSAKFSILKNAVSILA